MKSFIACCCAELFWYRLQYAYIGNAMNASSNANSEPCIKSYNNSREHMISISSTSNVLFVLLSKIHEYWRLLYERRVMFVYLQCQWCDLARYYILWGKHVWITNFKFKFKFILSKQFNLKHQLHLNAHIWQNTWNCCKNVFNDCQRDRRYKHGEIQR